MKIAVGLSGGVDSAVAALLLQEGGHDVVGVTMSLGREGDEESIAEARDVAGRLAVPFHVFDLSAEWKEQVLRYVKESYLSGRTPNPCVRCNETVKFGLLPILAFDTLGCDGFATGHYANVRQEGGVARLFRAKDRAKDQSYFLYRVPQAVLAWTRFPLGGMTKVEVRAKAAASGLTVAAKGDSQDFCGGDVRALVGGRPHPGDIVDRSGRVLGRHEGIWNYTIGKRKGLGIGGGTPYYVLELRHETNEVVVGFRDETVRFDLDLVDCVGTIDTSLPVKVRSAGEPRLLKDGISGVAPGQSAVFYKGDEVVGGGIIA